MSKSLPEGRLLPKLAALQETSHWIHAKFSANSAMPVLLQLGQINYRVARIHNPGLTQRTIGAFFGYRDVSSLPADGIIRRHAPLVTHVAEP